jgi:TetR/AcrR family transcriptional repressor of nem operon
MGARIDTRTRLLDVAQELAQTRGLNAFSFHDLAKAVGIRTASVHHHFPPKADLGRDLMARYRERFAAELCAIESRSLKPGKRLERFIGLFRQTLQQGNRLCLCGMLATEFATLPAGVKAEVRRFYDQTEEWLARVLASGRSSGAFHFDGAPRRMAETFLASVEGAMIGARTFDDESRFAQAARWLIASLESGTPERAS